ncbi:uncharacterized protein SPSK_10911 [Sporothrix schenckii 1099-18]|uniref:Uncharacterized protein n=1 Tax=Sporothrix schenckii 1099-18 TaxID=1397361 RepID=A0A0F2M7T6_SPOSC|nr:uncharacterized protein SPSK_10911 [Sporothrix schenckii 1099-18]KJR85753.1 hypothetical protein SPSK_10911 [Sporothrix schenckii 1099-18]
MLTKGLEKAGEETMLEVIQEKMAKAKENKDLERGQATTIYGIGKGILKKERLEGARLRKLHFPSIRSEDQNGQLRRGTGKDRGAHKISGRLGLGRRDGMICTQVGLGGRNHHPPTHTHIRSPGWVGGCQSFLVQPLTCSPIITLECASPQTKYDEHTDKLLPRTKLAKRTRNSLP